MPCNLAVTITKAAVTEEHLRKLLTDQLVADVLTRALQANDKQARVTVRGYGGVQATVGFFTVQYARGQINVTSARADRAGADALAEELRQLVAGLADALFAKQVEAALRTTGATVIAQQHMVTNGAAKQVATVLNFDL